MILHVACLPFPSHQGTQAAIDRMLRASAHGGDEPHLLTYAHGAYSLEAPYAVHRIADFPKVRSLRSGPSLGKVVLDMRCAAHVRALCDRLRPAAVVAHHIEAALAALAANRAPVVYIAHTHLEQELPSYFASLPEWPFALAGRAVERLVQRGAAGVGAVAPSLAASLGGNAEYVPVPWPSTTVSWPRAQARSSLGIAEDAIVCLYAGNLDRYQGWEALLDATKLLRAKRPNARLLVGTESSRARAAAEAARRRVSDAVDFRELAGEDARARLHAAADVAWIPRRTAGGLPIKMLEAFSRGVPVVAMERAVAGLPVHGACRVVQNDDPAALADAACRLIETTDEANLLRQHASEYLVSHHSRAAYRAAIATLLSSSALSSDQATPPWQQLGAATAPPAR